MPRFVVFTVCFLWLAWSGSLRGATMPPVAPARGTPAPAEPSSAPVRQLLPFHGVVLAVNAEARTLTLNGKARVFAITDQTKFTGANGAAIALKAISIGTEVRGTVFKSGVAWEAHTVIVGRKGNSAAETPKGAAATPAASGKAATPAPVKTGPTIFDGGRSAPASSAVRG